MKQEMGTSGFDILFPSEALIALLAIALVFKWMLKGFDNILFLKQPVTILIFIYLILSGISAVFSSMPLVSFKAFLVRFTYLLVFYFGVYEVYTSQRNVAIHLFLYYGYSLFFITLYCLYFQSQYNWDKQTAGISVNPFYSDHTIYSACAAFILPAFLFHFNAAKRNNMQFSTTVLGWICILAFFLGIYFTFCRAAWISIFITLLFFISIKLKFKIKTYFFLLFAALVFIITNKEELIYSF